MSYKNAIFCNQIIITDACQINIPLELLAIVKSSEYF